MPAPVHPYSDYGIALRTLRAARGWLAFLLFAAILTQLIGFALVYYSQQPYEGMKAQSTKVRTVYDVYREREMARTTTQPENAAATQDEVFFPGTPTSQQLNIRKQWDFTYTVVVPLTQILGLLAVSSQSIVVFITLLLILISGAPGVANTTRALIWSVLLVFMVMPWQYFARDFPIPGVLYGYNEMLNYIAPLVAPDRAPTRWQGMLIVARFIIWPMITLLALLITSERFRAGLMLAIGHPLQSLMQQRPAATNLPTQPTYKG